MGHDHEGEQTGAGLNRSTGRLKWTLGLVVAYMAAEIVGGLLANSLALLADAGHMLSDAGSLSLALFAIWIARRPPTPDKTFGYYRTEILAALANGVTLVLVALYIFREAWQRFQNPPDVTGPLMMGVAVGGLLVNGVGLYLLHDDRGESLNLEGAWLHVMADALGSVGAIAAGAVVWWTGWNLADPIASALIGLLVLGSSWRLLRESVAVLMEGAPAHLDVDEVRDAIRSVNEVTGIHDLHIWTITSGRVCLSAHVERTDTSSAAEVLESLREMLRRRFEIRHCTLQIEPPGLEEEDTPW